MVIRDIAWTSKGSDEVEVGSGSKSGNRTSRMTIFDNLMVHFPPEAQ